MSEAASETSPQPDAIAVDDVTVTTMPFALTPKVYFKILLRFTFWTIWWRIALVAIFMAYCLYLCCFHDEGIRFSGFLGGVTFGRCSVDLFAQPIFQGSKYCLSPSQ